MEKEEENGGENTRGADEAAEEGRNGESKRERKHLS